MNSAFKKQSRKRRATKTRAKISRLGALRLTVHRTAQHIYAQIIEPRNNKVMVVASSLEKDVRGKTKNNGGNIAAAQIVGELLAKKAKKVGVTKVAFDRSGFKYHGRVRALADAAREGGIEF